MTRLEVRDGPSFPGTFALGSVDDVEPARAVAHKLGRRLAACGVNLNWAPSGGRQLQPGQPRSSAYAPSAPTPLWWPGTPPHSSRGISRAAGVAACTKHFPGHGDTAVDSHLATPRIDVDLDTLHARELLPFRAAPSRRVPKSVMSAHILLPALDPDRPRTLSPRILTGLLRTGTGLRRSDRHQQCGDGRCGISRTYGIERGSVLAIAADANAICGRRRVPADEETVLRLRDALVAAVHRGDLGRGAARGRGRSVYGPSRPGRRGPGGVPEPGAEVQGGPRPAPRAAPDIGPVPPARRRGEGHRHRRPATEPGYVAESPRWGEHHGRRRDPLGHRRRTHPAPAGHREWPRTPAGDADPAGRGGRGGGGAAPSSPWSATNTAMPGWARRWTPC
ncbi:beta-N-acetylhexosaminidase OS=Streptomyces microflavus OX=1919 GN=G3I39_07565 PE=3 SV=1 [Streptomyces microflavus]